APSWRSHRGSYRDTLIVDGALVPDRRYHDAQEALMASDREPSQQWELGYGQAWVFTNGDDLVTPVVLAADVQDGPTDMAAVVAGLDHESYSFLSALRAADRDLVLLGYRYGNARLVEDVTAVTECVSRTTAERRGDTPLAVGGVGRGAAMTCYSLVRMEYERRDHETATYFSYNGSALSKDEAEQLNIWVGWPQRPLKLKAVSGEFKDELNDDDFDDTKVGAPNSGGALITRELGSWIIDKLSTR
ncbi:MAG: hypothetical protein ACRDSO_13455, partial [Pseudonocardiaceae bacterium]